jgi:uncharacterized protein
MDKPVPIPSRESLPYWEAAKQGRFVLPVCRSCGRFQTPPTSNCAACWSTDLEWAEPSGRGKVVSVVVYHRAYHPGFRDDLPYAVALVELAEGPRLVGNVLDVPPEEVREGTDVTIVFEERGDWVLPQFSAA